MSAQLLPLGTVPDWTDRAACLDVDADLFFSSDDNDRAEAKRICKTQCDVRQDCLAYALERGEDQGIWGGLDEDERSEVYRHARRTRRATREATG